MDGGKVRSKLRGRTFAKIVAWNSATQTEVICDLGKDARIGVDLDQELRDQPGLIAWYVQLREDARERYEAAKHHEHNVYEDFDKKVREALPAKYTEREVKTRINRKKRMREAYRERMRWEAVYNRLRGAVQAIEARGFSMKEIAYLRRMEFSTRDDG